jgi:hypothetical protein
LAGWQREHRALTTGLLLLWLWASAPQDVTRVTDITRSFLLGLVTFGLSEEQFPPIGTHTPEAKVLLTSRGAHPLSEGLPLVSIVLTQATAWADQAGLEAYDLK